MVTRIIVVILIAMVAFLEVQLHNSLNTSKKLIITVNKLMDEAEGWKTMINAINDNFQVCNSMLPKEKRL